ncbi:6402_t:CDS:2 [Entrophospora sp. SA101]|nr:6402_t:CDS:2 [Entrophospora sp. SA101]
MEEPTPNLLELEEKTIFDASKASELIDKFLSSYIHQKEKTIAEETENYPLPGYMMVPSYISRLPTGSETGIYLAMGLSGTTLKLTVVKLLSRGETEIEHDRELKIPDDLKVGTVDNLFDWIALNVKDLELLGVKIQIVAIVDDVVGVLVANAYKDQNTIISAIIDDFRTNAACICTSSSIIKETQSHQRHVPEYMIVNTEWGSIGTEFLPFIKYDKILSSQHQKQYNGTSGSRRRPFEQMIAGVYLGELVRLTIVDYVKVFNLFDGVSPTGMDIPYSFSSLLMSEIESDQSSEKSDSLNALLNNFEFSKKPSKEDLQTVHRIIKSYSRRSAQLFAIAIASLIKLQCPEFPSVERNVVVAVDGSIYHNHYEYSNRTSKFLRDFQNIQKDEKIKLSPIKDGSCTGAALIAMMYSH